MDYSAANLSSTDSMSVPNKLSFSPFQSLDQPTFTNGTHVTSGLPGRGPVSVVFICQPKSHPFQDRRVSLAHSSQANPVKVGRLMAKLKPDHDNAIFDCKVLSRNHAVMWSDASHRVWLMDTRSSNGTFVNSQRLSNGAEESAPREIFTGDVVQLGVEVLENQVVRDCIIAQISVMDESCGQEVPPPPAPSFVLESDEVDDGSPLLALNPQSQEQIYRLMHYLQEALYREKAMEQKMLVLTNLLAEIENNAEEAWQTFLKEDSLISKVAFLEEQLRIYSEEFKDDQLRLIAAQTMEKYNQLEINCEDRITNLLREKTVILDQLDEKEEQLTNREHECSHLRAKCEAIEARLLHINEAHLKACQATDSVTSKMSLKFVDTSTGTDLEGDLTREMEILRLQVEEMKAKILSLQSEMDQVEDEKNIMEQHVNHLKEINSIGGDLKNSDCGASEVFSPESTNSMPSSQGDDLLIPNASSSPLNLPDLNLELQPVFQSDQVQSETFEKTNFTFSKQFIIDIFDKIAINLENSCNISLPENALSMEVTDSELDMYLNQSERLENTSTQSLSPEEDNDEEEEAGHRQTLDECIVMSMARDCVSRVVSKCSLVPRRRLLAMRSQLFPAKPGDLSNRIGRSSPHLRNSPELQRLLVELGGQLMQLHKSLPNGEANSDQCHSSRQRVERIMDLVQQAVSTTTNTAEACESAQSSRAAQTDGLVTAGVDSRVLSVPVVSSSGFICLNQAEMRFKYAMFAIPLLIVVSAVLVMLYIGISEVAANQHSASSSSSSSRLTDQTSLASGRPGTSFPS